MSSSVTRSQEDTGNHARQARAGTAPTRPWTVPLVAWHADPAGKIAQPRQRAAGIEPEQVFGHPVDGRAVPDLGRRGALGCEQGPVASLRLSPLVPGTGDVDPVAALPLGRGDVSCADGARVVDGGPAVAEYLGDADLVEREPCLAERGLPAAVGAAEPCGGGGGLGHVLPGGVPVSRRGGGVGGDGEQVAV